MQKREPLSGINVVGRDLQDFVEDRAGLILAAECPIDLDDLLKADGRVLQLASLTLLFGHAREALHPLIEVAASDVEPRQPVAERNAVWLEL